MSKPEQSELQNAEQVSELLAEDEQPLDFAQAVPPLEQDSEEELLDLRLACQDLQRERDALQLNLEQIEDVLDAERLKRQRLEQKLKKRPGNETESASVQELTSLRARVDELETTRRRLQKRLEEAEKLDDDATSGLRAILEPDFANNRKLRFEAERNKKQLLRLQEALETRERRIAELTAEGELRQLDLESLSDELEQLSAGNEEQIARLVAEHEAAIEVLKAQHEEKLEQFADQNDAAIISLSEQHRQEYAELEQRQLTVNGKLEGLVAELAAERDELVGRLAEQAAHAEQLSATAQQALQDSADARFKADEMSQRYSLAQHKFSHAGRYSRLATKRAELIRALAADLREKARANKTLKAGLKSLRQHKAKADDQVEEISRRTGLLERANAELKACLQESQTALGDSERKRKEMHRKSIESANRLMAVTEATEENARQSRMLAKQAEKIEALQSELRKLKSAGRESSANLTELESLREEIARKNKFISSLERDVENNQRLQATVRKRDLEVKGLSEQLESLENLLLSVQQENMELKSGSARTAAGESTQPRSDEYERAISSMSKSIEEYRSTIATLTTTAEKWRSRYEDLLAQHGDTGFDTAATE